MADSQLPYVGAQAVLLGVSAFNANAASIEKALANINTTVKRSTQDLGPLDKQARVVTQSFDQMGRAATNVAQKLSGFDGSAKVAATSLDPVGANATNVAQRFALLNKSATDVDRYLSQVGQVGPKVAQQLSPLDITARKVTQSFGQIGTVAAKVARDIDPALAESIRNGTVAFDSVNRASIQAAMQGLGAWRAQAPLVTKALGPVGSSIAQLNTATTSVAKAAPAVRGQLVNIAAGFTSLNTAVASVARGSIPIVRVAMQGLGTEFIRLGSAAPTVARGFTEAGGSILRATQGIGGAVNQASVSMGRLEQSFNRATKTGLSFSHMLNVAVGVGLAQMARHLGRAIGAITSLGPEFQRETNTIRVFGDATETEMRKISAQAIELSRNFETSAVDIAKAGVELIKAGASADQMTAGLTRSTVVLTQAAQGQLTLAQAATTVAKSVNVFNIGLAESDRVVNSIVGVVQRSVASFTDMEVALRTAGGTASQQGLNIEEFAAAVGIMANEGLQGTQIGTGLVQMFRALNHPTADALVAMKEYRLSLYDANGAALPFIQVLAELERVFNKQTGALKNLSDMERNEALNRVFNTRSSRAALALASAGVDAYREQLRNAEQDANAVAQSLQNNLIAQLKVLGNQFAAAVTVISEEVIPGFTNLVKAVNDALRGITAEQVVIVFNDILNAIQPLTNAITSELIPAIIVLFEQMTTSASEADTSIVDIFTRMGTAATTFVTGTAQSISLVVEIFKILTESGQAVEDDLVPNFYASADASTTMAQVIADAVKVMIHNFGELLRSAGNALRGIANFVRGIQTALGVIAGAAGLLGAFAIGTGIGAALGVPLLGIAAAATAAAIAVPAVADGLDALGASVDTSSDKFDVWEAGVGKAIDRAATNVDNATKRVAVDFNDWLARLKAIAAGTRELESDTVQLELARARGAGRKTGTGFPDLEESELGFPPAKEDKGGGGAGKDPTKADQLKELEKVVRSLLRGLPILTDDLVEFIAKLAQDAPERLAPMIGSLIGARDVIGQMVLAKRDLLKATMDVEAADKRIAVIQSQIARIELEQAKAVLEIDHQLLALRIQIQEVERQEWPLRDRLRDLDREQTKATQDHLARTRTRLQLELQALPIRHQIENIDQKIRKLSQEDFAERRAKLGMQLEDLATQGPLLEARKKLRDIERQITDVIDQRFHLEKRREQILAQRSAREQQDLLRTAQRGLEEINAGIDAGFLVMDVPAILALEKQRLEQEKLIKVQEAAVRAADDIVDAIGRQISIKREDEELTQIGLELEKLAIEAVVEQLEREIEVRAERHAALEREWELRRIMRELAIIALEEEKRGLEEQLGPIEERIRLIKQWEEADALRGQIAVTWLEEERRKILEQLQPLEDQRAAIERVTSELTLQRDKINQYFETRKLQLRAELLDEQIRRMDLEETRAKIEEVFAELVTGFVLAMAQSGAFSTEEAEEVAKRLGLWSDQAAKLVENTLEMWRLDAAADAVKASMDAIPKDITITITTHHRDTYENGGGGSPGAAPADPNYMPNSRMANAFSQPAIAVAASANPTNNTTINNYNMDFDANYAQTQSPVAVRHDLAALLSMTRR